MDFCTLGMFIIDDIYFPVPRAPVIDIIGGAGAYSALGARLFRKPPTSRHVSWTVHAGSDFPDELRHEIDSWKTSCRFIDTPGRLTTHSLNIYGEDEYRGFEYTTPKKRLDETMLTEEQLLAKCFHLICAPVRCMQLVEGIIRARSTSKPAKDLAPPLFIWEPVPDSCRPEEYDHFLEALKVVDVVSPNHHELAGIFGQIDQLNKSDESDIELLQGQCERLLADGFHDRQGNVVVRRGEKGCCVYGRYSQTYFPAYHQPHSSTLKNDCLRSEPKVVDPTGGGNAFLGGFCIGLLDGRHEGAVSYEQGAVWGSVAASFAIEQVGMPQLSIREDGAEIWNGETVADRIEVMERRGPLSREMHTSSSLQHIL
ncbi:hypothetical protein MMC18_008696 [Xylographa bjoerkii]|nr:hypothetical protein [Xylographa bjoerkii]